MYSLPVKATLLPPHPLVLGLQQSLVFWIMVPPKAVFERTKQVKMWRCKVRTARCLQQHWTSKLCDGLSSMYACARAGVRMEGYNLWHFSCGMNSTKAKTSVLDFCWSNITVRVHIFCPWNDVHRNNALLNSLPPQKNCSHDYFQLTSYSFSVFFLPISSGAIASIYSWNYVRIVVYVFLSLAMYTYCCPCILRRGYPDWGFSVLFPRL